MNPIIIDNNLSAQLKVIHDNADSLAIDGANGSWFNISVNANSSFTFSNITTGIVYEFLIKNSHLTDTITITLPNTADIKSDLSYDITADSYIELSMFYDGTNRIWQVSNELAK